jgi:outer membrane protein
MVRIVKCAAMVAAMTACVNQTATAEDSERGGPPRWSVGAVGLAYRSPFEAENTNSNGDEKIHYTAVPYIAYRGDDFYLEGLEMGYHLMKPADGTDLSLSVDVIASARMLPGQSRNKVTADAGLRLKFEGALGSLSLTGLQDVTGEHDGQEFKASYSYTFSGEKWSLTPSVGLSWQSKGLADHMWGVTAEQQVKMIEKNDPVLPLFTVGDSVLNYEASVFAMYRMSNSWSVIAFGGVTFLDKKTKANPGINEDLDATIGLGLSYSF